MKKIITNSAKQTKDLGIKLAKNIVKKGLKKTAVLICLKGNLGSGKTTFLQGFAKGLRIKNKILSPTFVIFKRFKINGQFKNFYHFDCYRINTAKEMVNLGFKDIVSNPENIIAIEWPEKIKKILPRSSIINLEFISKNKRKISFVI